MVEELGYIDAPFGKAEDVVIRLPVSKTMSSAQQADQVMAALKAKDPAVKPACGTGRCAGW
jgi:preprotein translocase subunit SecF